MNIKGLVTYIIPQNILNKSSSSEKIKSEDVSDRDANGQYHKGREEERSLNEEEFLEAIKKIQEKKSIRDSGLIVKPYRIGNLRFAVIEDVSGKVVRKIPDKDLFLLLDGDEDRGKGNLLNKAM